MWIIQRMSFASVNRQNLILLAFVLHFAYVDVNHQDEISKSYFFKYVTFVYVNFIR